MMREDFVEDSKVHAFVNQILQKTTLLSSTFRNSTSPRLVPGLLANTESCADASCLYAAALDIARCRDASTGQRLLVLIRSTPAAAASPQQTPQGDIDAHYRAVYIRIHI
jgi:hypothetical protein